MPYLLRVAFLALLVSSGCSRSEASAEKTASSAITSELASLRDEAWGAAKIIGGNAATPEKMGAARKGREAATKLIAFCNAHRSELGEDAKDCISKGKAALAAVEAFLDEHGEQVGPPDLSPFVSSMPRGWRMLTWGMAESKVRAAVASMREEYDYSFWDRQTDSRFSLLLPSGNVATTLVPGNRFHTRIVNKMELWFDVDRLVAVSYQSPSGVGLSVLIERAAEAYGAQPREFYGTFAPPEMPILGIRRKVYFWRGNETTTMMWDESSSSETKIMAFVCSDPAAKNVLDYIEQQDKAARAKSAAEQRAKEEAIKF